MSTSRERIVAVGHAEKTYLAIWTIAGLVIATAVVLLLVLTPARDSWLLLVSVPLVISILVRPIVGLYLLPLVVAFGSLLSLNFHAFNAGLTDLLVATLAFSLLWRVLRNPQSYLSAPLSWAQLRNALASAWQYNRVYVLVFASVGTYLLVVLLSAVVAESSVLALKEVIKWAEVLLVLALSPLLIRSIRDVQGIVWAIIAAGLAQALLGYWQWVQVTGSHSASADSLRVFGTFGQPNPFVGYLNFGLLLALALVLFSRDMRERWSAGAAAVLIFGAETLADSRGGELGLAVALAVMVIVALGWERMAGLLLAVGGSLGAIAWFAHLIPAHIRDSVLKQVTIGPVNSANFSVQERLAHWVAGLRMFHAHPLLGVGAGNYAVAYAQFELPDWMEALGHAHNYYINAAAETGIFGFLALVAMIGITWFVGWRAVHIQGQQWKTHGRFAARIGWAFALGLLGTVVAHSIHNLTDDLFVHGIELQFALCLACLLWLNRQRPVAEE